MKNVKPHNGGFFRFVFLWVLAGLLEMPVVDILFFRLDHGELGALVFISHLASSGALFLAFGHPGGLFHPQRVWGRFFFFLSFFLPLIGWAACGCFAFIFGKSPKKAPLFEEDLFLSPISKILKLASLGLSKRERILKELDFVPLADVFSGNNNELKRGAIEKLAQLKSPEAIAILLNQRSNPSIEIRFYTTQALAKIKKEFDEELEAAKKQMQKNVTKGEFRLFLAKIYLQYTGTHLLDEVTNQSYETEALHHLHFSLQFDEMRDEGYFILLTLYRKRLLWSEFLKIVDMMERKKILGPEQATKKRVEAYYETKDYPAMAQEFQKIKVTSDPEWKPILAWWGV